MNRTLTQKYDMGALRALQKLESDCMAKLADIFQCDEDDVTVELDLLCVYNAPEAERDGLLTEMLTPVPDAHKNNLFNEIKTAMANISAMPQK